MAQLMSPRVSYPHCGSVEHNGLSRTAMKTQGEIASGQSPRQRAAGMTDTIARIIAQDRTVPSSGCSPRNRK